MDGRARCAFCFGRAYDRITPPAEINDSFIQAWSDVVGAGPSEVFALSCALSRHQGRPSLQRAARYWISVHRRRAVFPAPSRQRVWMFRPSKTSYPSVFSYLATSYGVGD